jgi:type IV secretory pathway component VirB8
MLSVMTPSALSGLLVAGFLLVVLLIAINCLMDLKTNDRFPRNILNVGKES